MKNLLPTFLILALLFFAFVSNAQCFSEETFTTPGQSTFTIPGTAGESFLIEIEAKGADGGDFLWGANPQTDGGEGATMKGSFVVSGGSDLLVVVGTSGLDAQGSPGGGGGGGGSAVIIDNTDVLIAAAAGGGGGQGAANTGGGGLANTNSAPQGGAGPGGSGGGGFNAPGANGAAGSGGGAGTLAGQGAGGAGGVTAGSGGAGFGGGGGGSGTGGGGGGGYMGGDGAAAGDLSGKGGDSFLNTLYSGTLIFNTPGANGGGANIDGSVTITCIPQGDVEIALVSAVDPECFDGFGGSIEVTATGGLEPYQYSLNGGIFGDSPVFAGLNAGDYTVTVQDGTGSTDMLMVTLTSPPELVGEILNVVDNVCFGASDGIIEVIASGGTSANGDYGYSVNGSTVQSSGLFFNLPNGFYVISFFDDNLCTTQLTTSITSPDDLDLVVLAKNDVSCFGADDGSCSVEAFGGTGDYSYSIDGGPFGNETLFNDLSGGTYIITVMDEEGCTEEVIVFINEPANVTFDILTTELTCFDLENGIIEVVNIIGTAPFQFQLDGGEVMADSIFEGLAVGEYIVTVIDSAGCEYMQDVELVNADSLQLEVVIVSDVQCSGDSTGAVQLVLQNGAGMITYSVDQMFNFSGLFENLGAGEYAASAIDTNGCIVTSVFEIQESATFSITDVLIDPVSCFGGADGCIMIEVTDAIEPIQYSIDGVIFQDSSLFSGLSAGAYEIQVMDSTGCVKTANVLLDDPTQLQFDHLNVTNVACYGDASGQVEYTVSGGNPPYLYTYNGEVNSFMTGDTVYFDSLVAGQFIILLCDNNGCELTDTVNIVQNDSLQLFVSVIEPDNCAMESTGFVDLNAVGGFAPLTISLNGESNTSGEFDSLAFGDYMASVVDDLGCSTSLDFNIQQLEGLVLDSSWIGHVLCHGMGDGFIELFISNGTGEIMYWIEDQFFTSNLIENLEPGPYLIEAIDENGCSLEVMVEIFEPDSLIIEVVDANLSEGFITVEANGGTQPYRYSIDDKVTFQESATFTGLGHGDFTIIVIDANECESSVTYSLTDIEDAFFEDLKIYPNPVRDILYLESQGDWNEIHIDMVNSLGQIIRSFDDVLKIGSGREIKLDVRSISTGSYWLRLRKGDKVGYNKVLVF